MHRRLVCLVCFALFLGGRQVWAQRLAWDDFLNDLFSSQTDGETLSEQDVERLAELHESPFNINDCRREDLLQLPFIGVAEADSLLHYIRRHGPLLSAGEFLLVRSLDYDSRMALPLFVRFEAPTDTLRRTSLLRQWAAARHEVALNAAIPMYLRDGFKEHVSRATGERTPARYVGSPLAGALRYRAKYASNLSIGFSAKNDDGEPFAQAENTLFDAYSFYLQQRGGLLSDWTLGDYKIHIAKGLTAGIGYMNNGQALLTSRHDHSQGVFVHSGTDEHRFLRGGAATLAVGRFRWLAFASLRKLDGRVEGRDVYTLLTSGYHRLPLERERKHNVGQTTVGTSIDAQWRQLHAGISLVHNHYDHRFVRGSRPYQQYNPEGRNFTNLGVHYSYERRKLNVGGETALSPGGEVAALHDLRCQLPFGLRLYVQHRYYGRRYEAPLAWAYTGGSHCRGEHGAMVGLVWKARRRWTLSGYADGYHLLTPTYAALTPSNGYTTQLQALYAPQRSVQWLLRYRLRSRQESTNTHPQLLYAMKHTLRAQWKLTYADGSLTAALDGSLYKPQWGRTQRGAMVSVRASKQLLGFKAAAALTAFHTQSYDAALYAYQPALLYATTYSAFYYHGQAATLTLQRLVGRHLDLAAKFSALHYTNRDAIGTAERRIDGSNKCDLALQARWLF